jgi:hypothetical protein
MAHTSRSVGHAAAKTVIPLNEHDGKAASRFAQKLGCKDGAGESATNDGEGFGGIVRSGRGQRHRVSEQHRVGDTC